MKISWQWLREFVDIDVSPQQLAADLTNVGVVVETVEPLGTDLLFELDLTTNRPDCLSHVGVARDVYALYRKSLILVIADEVQPVALAGIMGGLESEISLSTREILLESAWFNPISIRKTSKLLGMHTEASHRFERGADVNATVLALDRAAFLIQQV